MSLFQSTKDISSPTSSSKWPLLVHFSAQMIFIYWPGADNDLSMNFLFTKHIHHLLGLPVCGSNTFSISLCPSSCLNCTKYPLHKSSSPLFSGFPYKAFKGNPGLPGRGKSRIANVCISFTATFFCTDLL